MAHSSTTPTLPLPGELPPSGLAPASAPLLAAIFDANPATVLLVSRAGIVQYANHGLKGEPAADVVDRFLFDLVPEAHAERVRVALSCGAPDSFEVGERGPAGPLRWWRVDVSRAEEDALVFVFCDVTASKREEARLRRSESLLVDAQGVAHMGTWEWDVTQPNATWSDELYRIYGTTPAEYTPSYKGYLQKVHPDDRARVMAVTDACFNEHKPYSHDERIFRPDGEMRWLHTWALPVLDDAGTLVRLVGVCQDVTEQKNAESAMRGQLMTRNLARRLLHDLIRRANVPERTVRELGRALAEEREGERAPEAFAEAFGDMGFGSLRFEGRAGDRFTFRARDLLESRPGATLPSCFLTLGYAEGLVAAITGKRALGSEMRCQSMGHEECRFVIAVQ